MAAPPALEAEVALRLGVDLGIEIVLLGPQRVGGVLVLEVLHQPGAVELAVTEIAGEGRQPASAEQAAAVAHRILAVNARPVGQRRSGDDDRAEQFRTDGGEHHHGPAGLAVADHAGFAVGLGMQRRDLLDEDRFGAGDVLDGLARHRVRQEADEVAGMPGLHGDADLAFGLEAADARTVAGARIDNDERPQCLVDLHARGRLDPRQQVIHRPFERTAVHDEFGIVVEHVRNGFRHVLTILVAALTHHVPEQDAALRGVDRVFKERSKESQRGHRSRGRRRLVLV